MSQFRKCRKSSRLQLASCNFNCYEDETPLYTCTCVYTDDENDLRVISIKPKNKKRQFPFGKPTNSTVFQKCTNREFESPSSIDCYKISNTEKNKFKFDYRCALRAKKEHIQTGVRFQAVEAVPEFIEYFSDNPSRIITFTSTKNQNVSKEVSNPTKSNEFVANRITTPPNFEKICKLCPQDFIRAPARATYLAIDQRKNSFFPGGNHPFHSTTAKLGLLLAIPVIFAALFAVLFYVRRKGKQDTKRTRTKIKK